MEVIDEVKKALMNNKNFDPFSEAYSLEKISLFLNSLKDSLSDIDVRNFSTLTSTFHINDLYKHILKDTQKAITYAGISADEAQKFLISSANRVNVVSLYKLFEFLKNKQRNDEIIFEELIRHKVLSLGIEVEANLLNGQAIEIINQAQKIIKHCTYDPREFETEGYLFAYYHRLFENGNLLYIIKHLYESAIWEDGYLKVDEQSKSITLKFYDPLLSYIKRIGELRLQRNVAVQNIFIKNNTLLNDLLYRQYFEIKHGKSIKVLDVINGEIEVSVLDNAQEDGFDYFLQYVSAIAAFYPFLQKGDTKLSNFSGLTLDDIFILLSEIAFILSKATLVATEKYANVEPIESDLNKYALRIKSDILRTSLEKVTTYSSNQIAVFLENFTFDSKMNDYWRTPLTLQEDYYIFLIEPLTAQNKIYVTDYLLQKGGVSMGERGEKLEKYLKAELENILLSKGFYYKIPQQKKFKLPKDNSEEIDLIINTEHTVVIVEIKCISSSVDPRSVFSAYKQLKKGAEQVKRKARFIAESKELFVKEIGNIDNKDVFGIVLTNLPNFTGLILEDIPIIDMIAMHNYFSMGGLDNRSENRIIKYYDSEEEFSRNIRKYLSNPPVVWSLKDNFHHYIKQITPDGFNPIFFAEVVEAKGELIE